MAYIPIKYLKIITLKFRMFRNFKIKNIFSMKITLSNSIKTIRKIKNVLRVY